MRLYRMFRVIIQMNTSNYNLNLSKTSLKIMTRYQLKPVKKDV